jgi:hypothetical protein
VMGEREGSVLCRSYKGGRFSRVSELTKVLGNVFVGGRKASLGHV